MGNRHRVGSSSASSDSDSQHSFDSCSRRRDRCYRSRRVNYLAAKHATLGLEAAPPAEEEKKKARRRTKLPPQQRIEKIWKTFSRKNFSKALAVLPFSPAPSSSPEEQANELLSAGYERAVEECRRKVRKAIAECKRINTRYRDPEWDIVSHVAFVLRHIRRVYCVCKWLVIVRSSLRCSLGVVLQRFY